MGKNRGPDRFGSDKAEEIIRLLGEQSLYLAAAESCTAGLVADLLAEIPGASRVFWGSFVCYTAEAKMRMLGVSAETIRNCGLVSRETAEAMVRGALEKSGAGAAVSVTGLAGPDGDGSGTPVGTVWIGAALRDGPAGAECFQYSGSRNEVRLSAAGEALNQILIQLKKNGK